ncbi:membrane-bound PQQ-dependent dehydrogenase, glucose/quinate/shikimate family, partial [Allosphingosinicella sp.]|uniref:membrane-bound PQQ-dependent dehydrogenase, glucose/quinate/shikimate family n=1 Tax=Allosphingosinicella sp. TaxID=2823234 RepID=UPI002FC19812
MAGAWERPNGAGGWAVVLLGLVFILIGLALAIGGIWLIALGGSWYYALAGIGLVLTGVLLALRRRLGAWVYCGIFVATVLWALWEVGLNGWALVPRVFAPAVLLLLVIIALPALAPREGGKRLAWGGIGAFVLLAAIAGIVVVNAKDPGVQAAVPVARFAAVPEPAPMQVGADWPAYGGTDGAQRYSPLNQINRSNAARLERAWVYRTGDIPEEDWGAETTPLKVGDTLYLCSARNILIALDPATGRERWRFDPQVSDDWIPYTAACRGVAYYESRAADEPQPASAPEGTATGALCAARIIEGTLDGRLIAVDARTGRPCPDFGTNGAVDIKQGMGRVTPGMVSITSAPVIVRGVVVTGHQVLDGQRRDAPSGVIQGYDAVTGEHLWAWDMMRPDLAGLPPEGQAFTRGTPNMWTTASGDEELGLVYLPMGNSAVDYWSGSRRPPENQYATSLVAIDVTTGRPTWHFQTVHKDVWDYDLGSTATLVDVPVAGASVPAIILPSKQGDIYVLDRRTGRPLTGVREIKVAQGGVEPEQRSSTQPVSLYHTLRRPMLTEKDMWGMSPIDQMICRIQFRRATYKGFYTPPTTDTRWIQYPGYNGGSDWGGIAVDPRRGVIVANYNDMPNYNRLVPRDEANRLGWAPRGEARGGSMGG